MLQTFPLSSVHIINFIFVEVILLVSNKDLKNKAHDGGDDGGNWLVNIRGSGG